MFDICYYAPLFVSQEIFIKSSKKLYSSLYDSRMIIDVVVCYSEIFTLLELFS